MDIFNQLGVSKHASETEVKKAFRRLAMRCHPDTKSENAPMDFHILLDVYERALIVIKDRDAKIAEAEARKSSQPVTPQEATPPTPLIVECYVPPIDEFELFNFDCVYRDVVVTKDLQNGGTLIVWFQNPDGRIVANMRMIISRHDAPRAMYRVNIPNGQLELTLIFA